MGLEGSSTGWGLDNHVTRKLMLVPVIILAVGLGVASGADPPGMNQTGSSDGSAEPSAIGNADELRCTRPLIDVIQGFGVTLLSLSIAFWDSKKYVGDGTRRRRIAGLVTVICTPLTDVVGNLVRSSLCVLMLWEESKFRESNATAEKPSSVVVFKRLLKSLLPWQKSPARILASSEIVVYTLAASSIHTNAELSDKFDTVCSKLHTFVENEKEALIVGTRIEDNEGKNAYIRSEMVGSSGALLLIQAEALPDFDQLKFLRGESGYAMIAIAVQAFGYVYAVVYRSATDLRVTPLEVMGLVFNIGLLIKVSIFSTCNPCSRPLVIYVNRDTDDKLVRFLLEREAKDLKGAVLPQAVCIFSLLGTLVMMGLFLVGVVTYYSVSMMAVSKLRVVIPVILFSVVIFVNMTFLITKMTCYPGRVLPSVALIVTLNVLLSAVVYVWATVVTIVYWDSEHFSTRAHPNLSDIIPFVG